MKMRYMPGRAVYGTTARLTRRATRRGRSAKSNPILMTIAVGIVLAFWLL